MARTNSEGAAAATGRQRTLTGLLRAVYEDKKPRPSQRQLGEQLGVAHTTVGRWLDGSVTPDAERVSGFLACLGVVGEMREKIMRLARGEGSAEVWVTPGPPGVADQLTAAVELESQATSMVEWSPLFVPGMLQVPEYARAIIGKNPKTPRAEVEQLVTLRLGRQHAIAREDPLPLVAILGVPAIRGAIGGDRTMLSQLKHLVTVSRRKAITLRLAEVDGDWHGGLLGSFIVYDFTRPMPSIVSLEHHRTASFVDGAADVDDYKQLASELLALAYDADESRSLIQAEIEKRENAS
ncbi:helix-turn-helix transcriptional regulator [Amycolatopsis sp. NPDC051102]|uniref:helix-turn-helix domain-containing protein n=1 Tax=Amycolatopsis sp. NPDC051102 TaxID=3155163 RepID=UPI00344A7DBB